MHEFYIDLAYQFIKHMLNNYVRIAFRNLAKNKFFSALNIIGLAVGMSACLTVIMIIRDQMSYDLFHPNANRLFRVNCQQDEGTKLASTAQPLGETLMRDYTVAESKVTLVRGLFGIDATTAQQKTVPVSGYYTESSFFTVFGFQLEAGNAATVLNDPLSIVLSKKTAEKLFGSANPIGESLTLKGKGTFTVTGVVATPPGKTHLDFDCLVSMGGLKALEAAFLPEQAEEKIIDNWRNHYMSHIYVLLQPNSSEFPPSHLHCGVVMS